MTQPPQTVFNVAAWEEEYTVPTAQRTKKYVLLKKSKGPRQRRENGTELRIVRVHIRIEASAATEINENFSGRQPRQDVKFSNVSETNSIPIIWV
jgi:hypothetical protein